MVSGFIHKDLSTPIVGVTMYKFFVQPEQVMAAKVEVLGPDVNHMKNVLRFPLGKEVLISDGDGHNYRCQLVGYEEQKVILEIIETIESSTELPVYIHLYQGLPKKDKMELVIQKSVELGVAEVTPLIMKRSIVKLDEKSKVKKQVRWQGIADSAAKQSKRCILPKVNMPHSIREVTEALKGYDLLLVPYENAKGMHYTRSILSDVKKCDKIGIIIGPEGGFDATEIEALKAIDAKIVSLGKRILRTETAGLALMSYLMIDMEEA